MLPETLLGNVRITRLIAGINLPTGRPRRAFAPGYPAEMLDACGKSGIGTVILEDCPELPDIVRMLHGRMNWIGLPAAGDPAFGESLARLMREGPAAVCLRSEDTDRLFRAGEYGELQQRMAAIRSCGVPAGLATCLPGLIAHADRHGWDADFCMAGLYDSAEGGDFCEPDAFSMLHAIRCTPMPCIAFRVLGSGRRCHSEYHTHQAIRETFQNIKRTDSVAVGFDLCDAEQIRLNAESAASAMAELPFYPYLGECDGLGLHTGHVPGGVPDYWLPAIEEAAGKFRSHQAKSDRVSSLIFVTDMHWEQNNGNTVPVINALKQKTGVKRVIFGGDLLQGQARLADAARTAADWVRHMNGLGEDGWYAVRGNHDCNGSWCACSDSDVWTDDEFYDHVLRHARNANADGTRKLYNYADDPEAKIRYYFLDNHASGSTPPDPSAINRVSFGAQLAWLRQTACELDCEWGIVVIQHMAFTEEKVDEAAIYSEEQRKLFPVIDGRGAPCFDEAGHFTGPYLADFRTKQQGVCESHILQLMATLNEIVAAEDMPEVIAVLTGHTHWDASFRAEGGYPVTATTSDAGTTSSQIYDRLCPDRTPGTDTEQLMDVVQIDRVHRKLYFTRVGPGFDREFSY